MRNHNRLCLGPRRRHRAHPRQSGARIVINYSSSQKEAEETADLCRKAGGEAVVVQGDVSHDEDCRKIVAAAAPWGRLDALVNNAGITKHVAHGNLDAAFAGGQSRDWDLAAANLIVQEANGRMTTLSGDAILYNRREVAHGVLVAAGRDCHASIVSHFRSRPLP